MNYLLGGAIAGFVVLCFPELSFIKSVGAIVCLVLVQAITVYEIKGKP